MKRRRLLVGAGIALSGCVAGAREESGPRRPPSTPEGGGNDAERDLLIRDGEPVEADDGSLALVVTVENVSGVRQTDTLVGIATFEGEEYRKEREVSVESNTEAEVTLEFDVVFEDWLADGGIQWGWNDQL